MPLGRIKNWGDFQHYKDRSPPWIKLHRNLLDNFDYARLPLASKALAPLLWLLAAESNDGTVNVDPAYLSFRTRLTVDEINEGLNGLIFLGFVEVDSNVLAPRLQDACLEGEGEGEGETEREGEADARKARTAPRTRSKAKSDESTLADWLARLGDEEVVPAADPIFGWAQRQGIPADWLGYAWAAFEDRYTTRDKTYADWRAAFRDHVKKGWLDIWRVDSRAGGFVLTTVGEQWKREVAA